MRKTAPKTKSCALTAAQFNEIALSFPGAHEKSSYGSPAIFILKKFFTRLRAEDASIVLKVGSIDERDMLLEADPATFHITDHYKNYPAVLARLDAIDAKSLKAMLAQRWETLYPKTLREKGNNGGRRLCEAQNFPSPLVGEGSRTRSRDRSAAGEGKPRKRKATSRT